jgi:aldehyde:ferredoxin oxidoreductase
MALNRKIAYIDLTSGKIETAPIPIKMRELFLGSRGLDAYLLYNHLKPDVDPLGADNVAIISAGILVGTLASATARTHVCGKSPLTNFLGSTNMGGFFAPELRWAGFGHLVIKGKAEKPVYLWVHNGEIEIRDAKNVWGKTVPEAQQAIRDELGDREIKVLTIGPAGERLVRFANIMTGPKNAGGRTGMGAVLGSKNLKAIAARGTMDINIAHPAEALEYNKKIITQITSAKVSQTQGTLGTPFIFGATNTQGLVRCRNFQLNQLEHADNVEAEAIREYTIGMAGCFGCEVHCREKYVIPEGPYKGAYDEGPEYSTQCAFSAEVDCRNALTILIGQHLANIYGMDCLETGSMIAYSPLKILMA